MIFSGTWITKGASCHWPHKNHGAPGGRLVVNLCLFEASFGAKMILEEGIMFIIRSTQRYAGNHASWRQKGLGQWATWQGWS